MPSKLKKAIGAVKDQTSISLAKVNSSSPLEVAVLKATTHDDVPIDERYVYEVLQLISSNKFYAAACARAIGKRITRTRNWVVALKSLMLVLRIFQDGDPYFPREVLHAMKRGAKILNLSNFRDDSNSSPWDFTAFVRTFALYLDERLDCFLTGKLQRRYTHKERDGSHSFRRRTNESVRDMKPSMLLDKILYWQRLLERAIATRPTGAAKLNRLVQISLYAVVRESFDLYKDISDGLAILFDSFFHLQYQSCVSAFQICVKASKQFEELSAFYSLCKNIGVGRTFDYPSVQTISEELIDTLQEFLKDQSSFSSHTRSPNKPLLLSGLATGSPSRSRLSYGNQSQFSNFTNSSDRFSDKTSEYGSHCTSLEDLISATETGRAPSISIDLEAYPDQFDKKSQREESFGTSGRGSSRSLPVTNSMIDLISLDDWHNEEEQKEQKQETKQDFFDSILSSDSPHSSSTNIQEQSTSNKELTQSSSGKGWELILAESMTLSLKSSNNNFGDVPNPQTNNGFDAFAEPKESGSKEGWELVLAGTPTQQQSTHQTDIFSNTLDALYNQPQPSTHQTDIFSNTFDASTAITLYNQPQPTMSPAITPQPTMSTAITLYNQPQPQPTMAPSNHYNPFLQDLPTVPAINSPSTSGFGASFSRIDTFSTELTFAATTPSFFVQNTTNDPFMATILHNSQMVPFAANNHQDTFAADTHKDDPFATDFSSGDMFNVTANQHNLQQQQQLWLQNQNKIIARHMANV